MEQSYNSSKWNHDGSVHDDDETDEDDDDVDDDADDDQNDLHDDDDSDNDNDGRHDLFTRLTSKDVCPIAGHYYRVRKRVVFAPPGDTYGDCCS